MKNKIIDNNVYIYLEGRIDSSNSNQIEEEIFEILKRHNGVNVIIDAENLEYISSAGLRVILKIKKDYPNSKIINVNSDVYEIFEMTGFTEMMEIVKAYRKISIDGCEAIGQGSNGKVYRLDPDTIVKVYFDADALGDIKRERELARKAFVLGIPTAIPYDVVKVNDTYGSVFELLSAKSFAKLIIKDPNDIDKCVDMSVDLLKKIHSTNVKPTDMPSEKEVVKGWVSYLKDYLPIETSNKLIKMVNDLKDTTNMLHGDYHVKNIMLQNGEVLLIDMDTLCYGHPLFEFASMFNAYIGFLYFESDDKPTFLGISKKEANYFFNKSLEKYFNTTDKNIINDVYDKASLIGYARIMRRTIKRIGLDDENGKKIATHCKNEIIRLVDKYDSLEIKGV